MNEIWLIGSVFGHQTFVDIIVCHHWNKGAENHNPTTAMTNIFPTSTTERVDRAATATFSAQGFLPSYCFGNSNLKLGLQQLKKLACPRVSTLGLAHLPTLCSSFLFRIKKGLHQQSWLAQV